MRLFGFEITRQKEMSSVHANQGGWLWGAIREPFTGAWQKNVVADKRENLLAFSAVFACIAIIAEDISKLRPRVMEQLSSGIWEEVQRNTPFAAVLRKPNPYQTRVQFFVAWVTMRLLYGNVYVLKERDARGIVTALHVLDSRLVTVMLSDMGDVFYRVNADRLSAVFQEITVPASEIIHDRGLTLFHPLIGVSPIFACGAAATQGIRIQNNSATFFENMSRPSGQLTSPTTIKDETAQRLKLEFEKNFSGGQVGRIFVSGDGLKYEPMVIPAADAQLIEQLKWTVEDVARCFRVPLYKINSGQNPTFNNISALNQDYYAQTLQHQIEAIEVLLDEGLNLANVREKIYGVEFDLDGLLRMDPLTRMDVAQKGVGAGVLSPNEARARENLGPVQGGTTPYLQQQNYSLAALDRRDSAEPVAPDPTTPNEPKQGDEDHELRAFESAMLFELVTAAPAA